MHGKTLFMFNYIISYLQVLDSISKFPIKIKDKMHSITHYLLQNSPILESQFNLILDIGNLEFLSTINFEIMLYIRESPFLSIKLSTWINLYRNRFPQLKRELQYHLQLPKFERSLLSKHSTPKEVPLFHVQLTEIFTR